jgi:chromosome segregation ATPase
MGLADDRELVPLGSGFDTVRRGGYNRAQVDEHMARLDADLRLLAADRDAAVSQASDLSRQLEAARARIESLRGQVDRLSMPPTSLEGLSERLQRMLRLAQDEANDIKARAEAAAVQIRKRAEDETAGLRTRYESLIAEMDTRRIEMETEHRAVLEQAAAEAQRTTAEAVERAQLVDAEAKQRRTKIEEDFEIAMTARRAEAMRTLTEQEATSKIRGGAARQRGHRRGRQTAD